MTPIYTTYQTHIGLKHLSSTEVTAQEFRTRTKLKWLSWHDIGGLMPDYKMRARAKAELNILPQTNITLSMLNALYTRYNKLVRQSELAGS